MITVGVIVVAVGCPAILTGESGLPGRLTEVTVTLTLDEALVLFEWLHRSEGHGEPDSVLLPGEETALWALSARLESILVEPFAANYRELVDKARQHLAEQG